MIVREVKLKNGTKEQYSALDEAILTAQFIRNKAVRLWMDSKGTGKADLYKLCKDRRLGISLRQEAEFFGQTSQR
ncbi:transposase [Microcoleus sp. ARI1-B5]|uniref:transposase n=1 Tax=unclassified Microcoleus TaxID=2642155 RepID=UPI002FCE6F6D